MAKATSSVKDAMLTVLSGMGCTDEDLQTILKLRTVTVEIDGDSYSLYKLTAAIDGAWRFAFNRGGTDFVIKDAEWRKANGL